MIELAWRDRVTALFPAWCRAGIVVALLAVLAGCGQSGPLVLPGELEVGIPAGQTAEDDQGEDEDDDEQ